ncbi:hypothetical protein N7471_013769 [Penicillium samsonianum]|uniref:uncharacterized protein n=1 Tax=Penicillium samsonianum TaxID=1882272 RepID=UPI002548BBBC|nr:uncharacterized protein N7471_013769 [Penicillium samsonianum]KAJ6118302.1 hypothetical protein N7471_013769 [Penicillium samsonianum]
MAGRAAMRTPEPPGQSIASPIWDCNLTTENKQDTAHNARFHINITEARVDWPSKGAGTVSIYARVE